MAKIVLNKIAYEPHPVSLERKRELNAQGFKIIDARFAPPRDPLDHDGDGKKGGSLKPDGGDDLDAARATYSEVVGKRPFHGWDVQTLNAKIAEAKQNEEASNGLTRREIEADLVAMHVEFDPADKLDDLAALRDLAREERNKA